uniref:BamA/TamA family outer membrane protein n=1 Tax=Staphylococcus aureus TaxID=1280 RepID=UPI00301E44E0
DFGGVRAGVPEEIARRNTLVLRYSYEDVRLYNIGSLLIADLLRPDRAVRISRLAVDFARDTRNSRIDATSGEYLTLNYSLALSALGGNISFNRFE